MGEQTELSTTQTVDNLIVVQQLPIITERLHLLAGKIDEQVAAAQSLVCTEETVKEVKKVRTELRNQFKELEDQRKTVKQAVAAPYMEFEATYKDLVTNKFKAADATLEGKIDTVETELKAKKQEEVERYFDEYAASKQLDFLHFSDAHLNITLSATVKSLKEQAAAFVDKVASDMELIETQEFKDEIMVEFKGNGFDGTAAICLVIGRHKQIEAQKEAAAQREEERRRMQEAAQHTISAAPQVLQMAPAQPVKLEKDPNEILIAGFRVRATRAKLIALRAFLESDSAYEIL